MSGGGGLHARGRRRKGQKRDGPVTHTLNRTKDILGELGAAVAKTKRLPVLVGFAAKPGCGRLRQDKREQKRVDLIVANDVSRTDAGFDVDTNAVTLVSSAGTEELPLQAKSAVAAKILDRVEQFLAAVRSAPQKA
jgi:phosphopantothenoylcysteine decarboxylase/phosphopantothenate--cysteine ligase